jgi:hypothetical protein
MSSVDRQRIAAVRAMEALGHTFDGFEWKPPVSAASSPFTVEADTMQALLVQRAVTLSGCTEGSPEEKELSLIAEAIAAYEGKRWPNGMTADGKG